jgi:protocatechuate 3,4-dioxygenase beta subunit
MAPHVNLWVVARGINIGLNTRMYFADEHEAPGLMVSKRQTPEVKSEQVRPQPRKPGSTAFCC